MRINFVDTYLGQVVVTIMFYFLTQFLLSRLGWGDWRISIYQLVASASMMAGAWLVSVFRPGNALPNKRPFKTYTGDAIFLIASFIVPAFLLAQLGWGEWQFTPFWTSVSTGLIAGAVVRDVARSKGRLING